MSKGVFITLEGPDGCGKTCQIPGLVSFLQENAYDVVATREPGGTIISEQIREVIMAMSNQGMHPRTEILLFQAARAQHVEQLIRPSLEAGKIVICDRYADSTLAYQGYGHQTNMEDLRLLVDFATAKLKPDLTLYLDLDVEDGLKRRLVGGGEWNRMDNYDLEFHQRVRVGYHKLIAQDPDRWVTLDAHQSIDELQIQIRKIVLDFLHSSTAKKG